MLLVHILGGGLALVAGYVALFSAKGARVHRKSGLLFVCAMVAMGISATVMAAVRGVEGSVLGGLLAAYLVITALTTVRPSTAASRRLDSGLMLLAMGVGVGLVLIGFQALASRGGTRDGVPAAPIFMNGAVALLAGVSDLRVIRSHGLQGTARLARHLWRMCFALFIAAGSFFLGQADELPEPLRIPALLALPVLAVLVAMPYWLWRVRVRRPDRGSVGASAAEPARRTYRTGASVPVG
jgi:uncharacterized membrane protein